MKRLILAAALALGVHAALLRIDIDRTAPVLQMARSRAVDISLVAYQKPVEKPAPPKPVKSRPEPAPKPDRPPKPAPKPVVQARRPPPVDPPAPAPEPIPVISEPPPPGDPMPPVTGQESALETAVSVQENNLPVSHEEHAAVRVSEPRYDFNPPPVYPRVARKRLYQGTVLLDVRVTADGTAAEVKLAQSSGYSVLDRSAVSTVKAWRFEPARVGSRAIEKWVQVPVKFELK